MEGGEEKEGRREGLSRERLEKVKRFETFLNDVLRVRLGEFYTQRNSVFDEISQ